MAVLDMLFDNAFFRLPMMEAMTYLFVMMCIIASGIGLGRRFAETSSRSTEQWDVKQAA